MKNNFVVLSLCFLLLGCNSNSKNNEEIEVLPVKIQVETPQAVKYTPSIKCYGNLSFTRKTGITAASDGLVERIYGEVGDTVKKNQILLVIKNTQLTIQKSQLERSIESAETSLMLSETQVEEAKRSVEAKFLSLEKSQLMLNQKLKELALSESTLLKKEELFDLDGISGDEIENLRLQTESLQTNIKSMKVDYQIAEIGFRDKDLKEHYNIIPEDAEQRKELLIELNIRTQLAEVKVAKAQVKSKEAELESLQLLIDELIVRSPYSGILGARQIEEGERVNQGDELLTTFTDKEIYAVFTVQESQINLINIGQIVSVNIPSLQQPEYDFKITQISPTIDQKSGNITVKAISDNISKEFIPGMFFKGVINISEEQEHMTISGSSVIFTSDNEGEVFLVRNNKIFKRQVSLSEPLNETVWVTKGLSYSDKIVCSPSANLKDGMEVYTHD